MSNDAVIIINNVISGGGGTSDHKVMVTGSDSSPDYLSAKVESGEGVNLTVNNIGGDENLVVESELIETILGFAFSDVSPVTIKTAVANEIIDRVKVYIDTAFDTAVTFSIGESGNTDRYMTNNEIDMNLVGVYETEPGYQCLIQTDIKAYFSFAGASQGAGRVFILSRKP